jgi:hypothetical protein
MADDPEKPSAATSAPGGANVGAAHPPGSAPPGSDATPPPASEETTRERDRGISDLFKRAVAVGLEAAGRSKDDFVRIASTEVRGWLDHLELDTELRKALSKMVLEVKAEIRFRPTEDGSLVSETESEMRVRPPKPDRKE